MSLSASTATLRTASNNVQIVGAKESSKSALKQHSVPNLAMPPRAYSEPINSRPVGFLFMLDKHDTDKLEQGPERTKRRVSSSEYVIEQFTALHNMFPTFPKTMLHFLFVQERGNAKAVADNLIDRGWPRDQGSLQTLGRTPDPNFTTPYYFGLWNKHFKRYLRKAPTGSYLSAVHHKNGKFRYSLYFVKAPGCVEQKNLLGPTVSVAQADLFQLSNPIKRPANLETDYIPFCSV
jgi:hypothetical protein